VEGSAIIDLQMFAALLSKVYGSFHQQLPALGSDIEPACYAYHSSRVPMRDDLRVGESTCHLFAGSRS